MIRSLKIFILVAIITLASFTPAWAAEGIRILSQGLPIEGEVTFEQFFKIVFAIALGVAIIAAVLMLVIAGVEYTAAGVSAEAKNDAKHRITAALSGLLLAFAAWLILYEINPNILDVQVDLREQGPITTGGPGGDDPPADDPPQNTEGWYFINTGASVWVMSEKYSSEVACNQARANLNSYEGCKRITSRDPRRYLNTVILNRLGPNISINRGDHPCFDNVRSSCTTVAELPELAIAKLKAFAEEAGTVIVTGATETAGHGATTEHGPRRNVVDIGATTAVNRVLNPSGAPLVCRYQPNGTVISYGGGTYYYEPTGCGGDSSGNHWHVKW